MFVTASCKYYVPGVVAVMLTVELGRKDECKCTDVTYFFRRAVEQCRQGATLAEGVGSTL